MRPKGKPLVVRGGQELHVGGFAIHVGALEDWHTMYMRCVGGKLSPWYHRPPGDGRVICLRTKPRR